MAGHLKIIATPIGNLADMSPRAIHALKESQVILAENITHSRKLFNSIGLDLSDKKLISCSLPEEPKRIPVILGKGVRRAPRIDLRTAISRLLAGSYESCLLLHQPP